MGVCGTGGGTGVYVYKGVFACVCVYICVIYVYIWKKLQEVRGHAIRRYVVMFERLSRHKA